ncbi:MAG: hypothetical protein JWM62_2775 [Frankiales bacterium]|nr:hypothetical protein [Frankiales bacterium]
MCGALDVLPRLPADVRLTVNLSARALLLPSAHGMLVDLADDRGSWSS